MSPVHDRPQFDAERYDFVLCARKATFDALPAAFQCSGNLEGPCCRCGETVVFRPTAPKRPPRLCMECFAATGDRPLESMP